ncbi:hypothetical protein C0J52_17481 [Blattella germanica]|nr:hypothetical protein C0J52_17481 [Blattella germanica]
MGIVKEDVRKRRYVYDEQLRNVVRAAFQNITPNTLLPMNNRTWKHIRLCCEHVLDSHEVSCVKRLSAHTVHV